MKTIALIIVLFFTLYTNSSFIGRQLNHGPDDLEGFVEVEPDDPRLNACIS